MHIKLFSAEKRIFHCNNNELWSADNKTEVGFSPACNRSVAYAVH